MKEVKAKHYIDTTIHSVDIAIRTLKYKLKQKIDSLNIGITSEQFVVLDTIDCHNGIYQQQLSDILMKDGSNTTRIIKVLIEKGLITKEVGQTNNRLIYKLNITEQGKHLVTENMPKIKKYITELFENITDEEIDILHSLSKKFQGDLLSNLEQ
ncbi:MAG: MarR family winged helix-turn-helix transcriptional regulator [Candidatus Gastranaerophilaceae bacterium]